MPKHDCDICRGAGKVRLPVWSRAFAFTADALPTATEAAREYPCPECADVVRLERVQAAREEGFAATYIKDLGYIQHAQESLAHQLVSFLLRHQYIKFERGPDDDREMWFGMRATIGVVRPNQLDNLEERIAERQTEVAQEVSAEAIHQVNNWGSHYGHADILKRDATRLIGEATQSVLKKRAEWKPMPSRS
jgi:hypothetical protein